MNVADKLILGRCVQKSSIASMPAGDHGCILERRKDIGDWQTFPSRRSRNGLIQSMEDGGDICIGVIQRIVLLATWFGPLWRFNLAHPLGR